MITRSLRLLAAALVLTAAAGSLPAFADGRNKPQHQAAKVPKLKTGKLATKTPCPLGPGDRFTTGERPTKHTYNCSGAFVVTDNVASTVTLPDHMETVAPIIHRAGEPDPCGECKPTRLKVPRGDIPAEPVPPGHPSAKVEQASLTLSDSFGSGGVGANIGGGGSGYSRAYIVSGGSAQGYASASAMAFAFASSRSFAGGGGSGGCGCGH